MLSDLISTSIKSLNLSVRDHAALAAGQEKIVAEVFKRERNTCHVCGSRCHNALEIDHVKGHKQQPASGLKAICQFCHNLKHPLWAGARKKIVPIMAAEISQVDLNRLAWVLLTWRSVDAAPINVAATIELIEQRRAKFEDYMGCLSAESLFEAAFTIAERENLGMKSAKDVLTLLDQSIRYWPAELTPEYETLDPGSRLSRWDLGGFVVIADEVAESLMADIKPDPEKIKTLMEKIREKA